MNPLSPEVRSLLRGAAIDEEQVLASGAVPANGADYLMDPQLVVELLADALRQLHSVDPTAAADTEPLTMASICAEASRQEQSESPPELDDAYSHMERSRLLEVLSEGAHELGEFPTPLVVVTHGRPSPATLWCSGSEAVGFTDWRGAAVCDPHRDLAYAASVVAARLGPMLVPVLIERYAVRPDPRRLDWWALAQQLTGAAATSAEPDGR